MGVGRASWQWVDADLDLSQAPGGYPPQAGDTWVVHQEELFAWKGYKTATCFRKRGRQLSFPGEGKRLPPRLINSSISPRGKK